MKILILLVLFGLYLTKHHHHHDSFKILALSDIHMDPEYHPQSSPQSFCRDPKSLTKQVAPYGRLGCDAP